MDIFILGGPLSDRELTLSLIFDLCTPYPTPYIVNFFIISPPRATPLILDAV